MTTITQQPPIYNKRVELMTANEVKRISLVGTVIKFLQVQGNVSFRINDQEKSDVEQGIGIKMPDGVTALNLTLQEESGTAATITYAVSTGDIIDDRSSITGAIGVLNAPAPDDILSVNDAATAAALATIQARLDEIYARQIIDLTATTSGTFANNATVVTSAANVNGVYIVYAHVSTNSAARARFAVDGVVICGNDYAYSYNTPLIDRVHGLYVPPGLPITYSVSAAINNRGSIRYRIL